MADKKIYVGEEGAKELYRRTKDNLAGAVNTINGELALKASQSDLESAVTDINTALGLKANTSDVNTEIGRIDGVLATKADTSALESAVSGLNTAISGKADAVHTHDDRYYTETEIDGKISAIEEQLANLGGYEVVTELDEHGHPVPQGDPSTKIIYLYKVPGAPAADPYKSWIYTVTGDWECIGETHVDLTPYYTGAVVDQKLAAKADLSGLTITSGTGTVTITLKENTSATVLTEHQDISGKANKSEMSITPGTGTTTIQLKENLAATVLTEHQDISGKVDRDGNKVLSTNDYTDADKNKLTGIETGAQANEIESVKVDGTALSIDANKAVNIPLASANESGNEMVYVTGAVTGQDKQKWDNWVSAVFPIIPNPNTVVIGGRTYPTVNIGNQVWLAENLDFKFTGCVIGQESSSSEPRANYFQNNEATYGVNGNKYGLLYNWIAVKYLEDHKSELIPGWHVPTTTEWDALATAVGGSEVAGTKLKSTTGWSSGNGDDSYGFAAFPAGFRNSDGSFYDLSGYAYFWTSIESSSTDVYYRYFKKRDSSMISGYSGKSLGFSVRLVKNLA